MIINIGDIEKVGIEHALRVAIGMSSRKLRDAFDCCHPDRISLDWYKRIEDDIGVMKELKRLLDLIEAHEE